MRSALPHPTPSALVTAVLLATGCAATPTPPVPATLEVVARVVDPGEPASWSARLGAVEAGPPPAVGCAPVATRAATVPAFAAVSVTRPALTALVWSAPGKEWRTEGPHAVTDPSWSVGDVHLTMGRDPLVAEGALRFGGMPRILAVEREVEGGVRLSWDPSTADAVEVYVVGPGGALTCVAGEGEARLPWWAVPADHGEVILRSRRHKEAVLPDGTSLRVRATIERVVPLDVPNVQAAEPPTRLGPTARPRAPRRSSRPPRPIFG